MSDRKEETVAEGPWVKQGTCETCRWGHFENATPHVRHCQSAKAVLCGVGLVLADFGCLFHEEREPEAILDWLKADGSWRFDEVGIDETESGHTVTFHFPRERTREERWLARAEKELAFVQDHVRRGDGWAHPEFYRGAMRGIDKAIAYFKELFDA
jgi:hypothetical protein